ncbi:MAG: type II toxin-antitoxin system HicB family antitoxin [Acidobacteria bacterium]|nr:type II toxin-antitoxin system HicB family antitoxin [Acidobacteriota bacterium]
MSGAKRTEPMSDTYDYPAEVERDEDGRYVVVFPDFGWGATDGVTRDEALAEARDLLRELMAATMREGKDLPEPSRATKRRPLVVPPVPIALKAAFYEAFREAGVSQRRLARDLDIAESEVRRMLNPDHATKAAAIDRALRRLGKRVSVTVGEAA